jgi:hypothetical protein
MEFASWLAAERARVARQALEEAAEAYDGANQYAAHFKAWLRMRAKTVGPGGG